MSERDCTSAVGPAFACWLLAAAICLGEAWADPVGVAMGEPVTCDSALRAG